MIGDQAVSRTRTNARPHTHRVQPKRLGAESKFFRQIPRPFFIFLPDPEIGWAGGGGLSLRSDEGSYRVRENVGRILR